MRRTTDFNFQLRRVIPKSLPKQLLAKYGKINFGKISEIVIQKLEGLVLPSSRINFSLLNIEHMDGNSFGYRGFEFSNRLSSCLLTFHFIADYPLINLEKEKIVNHKMIPVRYKVVKNYLNLENGSTVLIFSVGVTIKELGEEYLFIKNRIGELEVLYNILGPVSKSFVIGTREVSDYRSLLYFSPRYMIANYLPEYWAYNRYMWSDYPNLIPSINTAQAFFYLQNIHNSLKKSGWAAKNKLSRPQKIKLGAVLSNNRTGLLQICFDSLMKLLITDDPFKYLVENEAQIETVNPCFLACFNNFDYNLSNFSETKKFAENIANGTELAVKKRIYNLLWR